MNAALIIFLVTLVLDLNALNCTAQWECDVLGSSVTDNYNFVACINNTCTCRISQGFVGTATTSSKCTCSPPNHVSYDSGVASCMAPNSCGFQWECDLIGSSVTDNYNFVACINHTCTCRTSQGFVGNATISSKCTCPPPNVVVYDNSGLAHCMLPLAPNSTSCNFQYECASVSKDFNFVSCVNNHCVCDPGFSGNATSASPCFCDATKNKTLLWNNGSVFCVDVPALAPIPRKQDLRLATNCSAQWQCAGVTTVFDAVDCVGKLCICRNNLGWGGNGTVSDPCSCPSSKIVVWLGTTPYCIAIG